MNPRAMTWLCSVTGRATRALLVQVPDEATTVIISRCKVLSGRIERGRTDLRLVQGEGFSLPGRGRIPKANLISRGRLARKSAVGRCQQGTVRRQSAGLHQLFFAGGPAVADRAAEQIPLDGRRIARRREERPPVRMKSQATDKVMVAGKDLPSPIIRDPVEDNIRGSTPRTRGQVFAIRTESDRQQHFGFMAKDHQALPAVCIPKSHRLVVARRGQKPPIGLNAEALMLAECPSSEMGSPWPVRSNSRAVRSLDVETRRLPPGAKRSEVTSPRWLPNASGDEPSPDAA